MKPVKIALIALLLVLALVLGGCYSEDTNITTSNPGGDSFNFPVYEAPTNAPTNPPAEAPTDEPTDTPDDNPAVNPVEPVAAVTVSSWLPTIAPIQTTPVADAVVTPPPSKAPTATPASSLKLGSQGDAVRNVQRKLKDLGFYKGNVDGDFGEATEKAVKAFQKQYGLEVDGKVGENTMAKLSKAKATARPAVTATPKPTAAPAYSTNTYLRNGSSGKQVKQMQERLIALGYLVGRANSSYDNATEAAVRAFQNRNTSYSDGVAGPLTLKALYSSSANRTSSPAGIVGITLKEGSKETAAVRLLQQKLKSLGYYSGSVDGSFGQGTTDAVKAFQRGNGLTADGSAGSGTLNKLFSSSAKTARQSATATPKPRPTATLKPTPSPIPDNIYIQVTAAPANQFATLRRGMYGKPVEEMQLALKNQGYFTGSTDGYYGESTENAVKAFQRYNGLQVDGVAGPATLRTLLQGAYPFGS